MKYIISVLLDNQLEALIKVLSAFSLHKIFSLNFGQTHDSTINQVTIIIEFNKKEDLDRIVNQIDSLIEVREVKVPFDEDVFAKEYALVKVNTGNNGIIGCTEKECVNLNLDGNPNE